MEFYKVDVSIRLGGENIRIVWVCSGAPISGNGNPFNLNGDVWEHPSVEMVTHSIWMGLIFCHIYSAKNQKDRMGQTHKVWMVLGVGYVRRLSDASP